MYKKCQNVCQNMIGNDPKGFWKLFQLSLGNAHRVLETLSGNAFSIMDSGYSVEKQLDISTIKRFGSDK